MPPQGSNSGPQYIYMFKCTHAPRKLKFRTSIYIRIDTRVPTQFKFGTSIYTRTNTRPRTAQIQDLNIYTHKHTRPNIYVNFENVVKNYYFCLHIL
jgi:hypothetical protein